MYKYLLENREVCYSWKKRSWKGLKQKNHLSREGNKADALHPRTSHGFSRYEKSSRGTSLFVYSPWWGQRGLTLYRYKTSLFVPNRRKLRKRCPRAEVNSYS